MNWRAANCAVYQRNGRCCLLSVSQNCRTNSPRLLYPCRRDTGLLWSRIFIVACWPVDPA